MNKEVEGYTYNEGLDYELWASNTLPAFGVFHSLTTGKWEYYCVKDGAHHGAHPSTCWHPFDNPNITSAKERIEYARALSRLEG